MGPPPVTTGKLVITEFFADPDTVSDTYGEWVELYNPGTKGIDFKGWQIKDDKSNKHTIGKSVVVPAKGYVVLGRSSNSAKNGGVNVAYQYSGFTLSNGADQIELRDPSGAQVDRVADTRSWWLFAGYATALKNPGLDNTKRDNWCFPKGPWKGSAGDWGSSPGGPPNCNPTPAAGAVAGPLDVRAHTETWDDRLRLQREGVYPAAF